MKFLADENVTKRIVTRLRAEGHEVAYVAERGRRAQDRTVLRMALDQEALLLTFDKDYYYHVVAEKQPTLGVVWVRLARLHGEAETERVARVINEYGERLLQHLTIIYPDRVEMLPL
jgi:predicted nuclease of predicted toxin-antitoxin system